MAQAIELTQEQTLAATRLAGTTMGKICLFGAKVFQGTGTALEKASTATAVGLRKAADSIEAGGLSSSRFCYEKADRLTKKAEGYKADTATVSEVLEPDFVNEMA